MIEDIQSIIEINPSSQVWMKRNGMRMEWIESRMNNDGWNECNPPVEWMICWNESIWMLMKIEWMRVN